MPGRTLPEASIMLFALVAALQLAVPVRLPDEAAPPPGQRVALTDGQLFIPAGYQPEPEGISLTLHLHGAAGVAERNQVRSGQPGVLVTVVLPGLSAVYQEKFADPATLPRILAETGNELVARGQARTARVARLTVTSFSAGFGGVRELLKEEDAFKRIDALVMADSIYAGFDGDPAERRVSDQHIAGFLRFAREAAAGRKRMIITHTELATPTYASTAETADYLLRELGGRREMSSEEWGERLRLRSQYCKGGLSLLGFEGTTGPEHMRHLHGLWLFIRRLPK